jgi:hypothetical protein
VLVVHVAVRATSPTLQAALRLTGDPTLASDLRLVGTKTASGSTEQVAPCYEATTSEGWTMRRFAVRALPGTFAATGNLSFSAVVTDTAAVPANSSPSAAGAAGLFIGFLAVDCIAVHHLGAPSNPAAPVPKPSPLSVTNTLARAFVGGMDPTKLCRVSFSEGTVTTAGYFTASVTAAAARDRDRGRVLAKRTATTSYKPFDLRPAAFDPVAVNILVGGRIIARIPLPASGIKFAAAVEASQLIDRALVCQVQAIDAHGIAGSLVNIRVNCVA